MPNRNDQQYFLERERQSRVQAENANEPSIGKLHLDFAERYSREAAKIAASAVEA